MRKTPWLERFWDNISPEPNTGCWLWTGCITTQGYGRVVRDYVAIYAHRLSWEIHFGVPPKELDILHRCDVPLCVNPAHLFIGTARENMKDMWDKERRPRRVIAGHGTAGFRGICRYNDKFWQAKVYRPRQEYLGIYSTITEAKLAVLIYESIEGRLPR